MSPSMSLDQDSPPTLVSTLVWDVEDERGEDDELLDDSCDEDVKEVGIDEGVRRNADEKEDKPKSVIHDELWTTIDGEEEDVAAIAQLPRKEPSLSVLDCKWEMSLCLGEIPTPDTVLQ